MDKIRTICFKIQKNMIADNYSTVKDDVANIIAIIDSNLAPVPCSNIIKKKLSNKPLLKRNKKLC
jgi:hypothetical protein